MFVTPERVIPVFESVVPPVTEALSLGIDYADELQPGRLAAPADDAAEGGDEDADERLSEVDRFFWSHAARYRARKHLVGKADKKGWAINPNVPNSGIHLAVDQVHKVRVLRSLGQDVPHPGPNKRRRADWSQYRWSHGQLSLPLGTASDLPALTLILDWQTRGHRPVLNLSLPKRPWDYGSRPQVYWRVPITGNAQDDLAHLAFPSTDDPDTFDLTLKVDPAEDAEDGTG